MREGRATQRLAPTLSAYLMIGGPVCPLCFMFYLFAAGALGFPVGNRYTHHFDAADFSAMPGDWVSPTAFCRRSC